MVVPSSTAIVVPSLVMAVPSLVAMVVPLELEGIPAEEIFEPLKIQPPTSVLVMLCGPYAAASAQKVWTESLQPHS